MKTSDPIMKMVIRSAVIATLSRTVEDLLVLISGQNLFGLVTLLVLLFNVLRQHQTGLLSGPRRGL
jgi:hypothetical protein